MIKKKYVTEEKGSKIKKNLNNIDKDIEALLSGKSLESQINELEYKLVGNSGYILTEEDEEELKALDDKDDNGELSEEKVKIDIAKMESGDQENQNNIELSEEKVKIDIAKMESGLKDYDPKSDFEKFTKNLKESLTTNPVTSVKNPAGSKTDGKGNPNNQGGCCIIS